MLLDPGVAKRRMAAFVQGLQVGAMKVCDTCRFWSQMCAQALGGGPIEALCLCDDGPRHGEFTRGITTCDRWASNHRGQVDDPPDYGQAVRAAYEAEKKGEAAD